jgi:DNA-binding transcriptional MerR regulator
MAEPTYSVKEIIELQFRNLSKEMTEIKDLLKEQNIQVEKQFARLDKDIADLREEVSTLKDEQTKSSTRGNVIWGGLSVAGAVVISYVMNRIF